MAGVGDVNGDGYGDVVSGASTVSRLTGRAYAYLGSATGLSTTPATA
nr:FG-GAP repeat protein [Deltaproteobacteria bacterium]